jgi:hippurate hydrolase
MDGVMPIKNRFADLQNEMVTWRHDFHEYPELQFDLPRTTAKIIELLNEFGVNSIKTKIGKSGIVAEIYGQKRDSGRAIGFRADMDALPVSEMNNFSYKSKIENKMHACGHDGHTTILLGVAKYLCETRNFDGTVVLAFQPAEEGGGGAKAMVDDGLISDWNIEEIYGLHNLPNLKVGEFAIKSGPLMAASDFFEIIVEGKGGHAALPHFSNDTTLASSAIVLALQQIVSRRISALQAVVLSVTGLSTDTMAHNVTPDSVRITGTTRFLNEVERQKMPDSIKKTAQSTADAYGCTANVRYEFGVSVTDNYVKNTEFAIEAAEAVVGTNNIKTDIDPIMAGEDFSEMLAGCPGAFIFLGNGPSASWHNPSYDFNNEALPFGCSWFANLAEKRLPLG